MFCVCQLLYFNTIIFFPLPIFSTSFSPISLCHFAVLFSLYFYRLLFFFFLSRFISFFLSSHTVLVVLSFAFDFYLFSVFIYFPPPYLFGNFLPFFFVSLLLGQHSSLLSPLYFSPFFQGFAFLLLTTYLFHLCLLLILCLAHVFIVSVSLYVILFL